MTPCSVSRWMVVTTTALTLLDSSQTSKSLVLLDVFQLAYKKSYCTFLNVDLAGLLYIFLSTSMK